MLPSPLEKEGCSRIFILFWGMLTSLAVFFLVLDYLMDTIKKITNGRKTKTNESSKTTLQNVYKRNSITLSTTEVSSSFK
tara:strand:- start:952 stop:1191 length:240 start_codon:yes stop_codon:yes gene_type:complete